ncbi:hypothetical protein TNCV_4017601 [Trichonephila clavipes]|nr:hypothetical protein TNCV_4017601 [Trichonephila clavipes]
MVVQFRNEKVSNHGSIPITIDCNAVAFIGFEEGFHQPIKRTKQRLPLCNWIAQKLCICFPSLQRPLSDGTSRASEYNTMTETMTTTHRNSTFHQQHHPMTMIGRCGKPLIKQSSTNSEDQRKGVVFGEVTVANSTRNSKL